jgi:hypothetical protein
MNSVTTEKFRQLYAQTPPERRQKFERAFLLWRANPAHPSLRFKKVHTILPIYSARIDLDWRAALARQQISHHASFGIHPTSCCSLRLK